MDEEYISCVDIQTQIVALMYDVSYSINHDYENYHNIPVEDIDLLDRLSTIAKRIGDTQDLTKEVENNNGKN